MIYLKKVSIELFGNIVLKNDKNSEVIAKKIARISPFLHLVTFSGFSPLHLDFPWLLTVADILYSSLKHVFRLTNM